MESSETTDRFGIINAFLIALVTLIGAYVAWRASVASDNAGDAALAGLTATLNAQETEALNNTLLYEDYRAYTAYTRYNAVGDEIEEDLAEVTDETEAEILDRQMREAWDAAESFYFPREYLKRDGSYDTQRHLGEAMSEAARERDLNPTPHFSEADTMQVKSNNLIGVITILAVSLLFFTIVEGVDRPVIKYALVTLGVLIMIAGIWLTVSIEYFWYA
ncbi:MAG: hypothetical protein DPW09_16095 [Anaerolineae bacterium]|nr:hypothetical protein [Anaerolineales bacterium]MCQ3974961.1 hypothetical protein [Anaerolineae bacterium]